MANNPLAIAADYAEALLAARRAKNWLVGILLAILLYQLGLFAYARATGALAAAAAASPATAPAITGVGHTLRLVAEYFVGLSQFLGVALSIVLALDLLLIAQVMLVGRLIGLAHVTSSLIWCLVLIVLLFPWQAFLNGGEMTSAQFRIPGVLYTWTELTRDATFSGGDWKLDLMKWTRFVGSPIVAMALLLFFVQLRSRRGLRMALGEAVLSGPPDAAGPATMDVQP